MREFAYFLFENFDAEDEAQNPDNPRIFLGKEADHILSQVADGQRAACNTAAVDRLIRGGVLRCEKGKLFFDCPVFLKEDAAVLQDAVQEKVVCLADLIEMRLTEIRASCEKIQNGFSIEQNLYHILCGMIFDGQFFDYLSERGALAVSRVHPSGLDYLTVIYEKCEQLQRLSDGLLCSYNRLVNEKCSLQSFGDSQGNRFDFYRFFRLKEKGKLEHKFQKAETYFLEAFGKVDKELLLSQTVHLIQSEGCAPGAMKLLELFGYAEGGTISVPVYKAEHRKYIWEIAAILEEWIGNAVAQTLMDVSASIDITAVRHGVNVLEISNELYHIVFGSINEELALRGIVATPKFVSGEGRYLKCIEVY